MHPLLKNKEDFAISFGFIDNLPPSLNKQPALRKIYLQ